MPRTRPPVYAAGYWHPLFVWVCVGPCIALALGAAACGGTSAGGVSGHEVGVRFDTGELQARASEVTLRVLSGGCAGGRLVDLRSFDPAQTVRLPATLTGLHGLQVDARDAACVVFARGCLDVELPTGGTSLVPLTGLASPVEAPACTPSLSDAGSSVDVPPSLDEPAMDGGTGLAPDSGPAEAGPSDTQQPDAEAPPERAEEARCVGGAQPGLAACFDFDGTLEDLSGNANHASTATPTYQSAPSGSALRVAGETATIGDDTSLDLTQLTLEVWMRADGLTNLNGGNVSLLLDHDQQYNIGISDQGEVRAELYDASGNNDFDTPAGLIQAGQWHYLALTYDGRRAVVYVDGVEQLSEGSRLELSTDNREDIHIASGSPGTTRAFDGAIDALRVWNYARSAEEICEAAGLDDC